VTAATRGQAAYETWRAAVPEFVCNVPAGPWDELSPAIRAGFDAIAAQESHASPEVAEVVDFDDEPELTEHVSIRFPAAMAAAAKQLAAAEGMTVSAWIRREVEREAARREQPAPELAEAMGALIKVAASHERVMYAALIDVTHGDPNDALHLLREQLDGFDGPQWNGTETGLEWLERTREGA
jgi:hypothetical protein